MEPAELKQFLKQTSFFGGLGEGEIDRIAAMLRERTFAPGEQVFAEGDNGKSMYIVGEGELIVTRSGASGNECRLLMMRRGDFFGVTALIEMEPRPFSVRAERRANLYELTNADLYQLYREDQKAYLLVVQNINRELCRRLRKAGQRIARLEDLLEAHQLPQRQ